MKLRRGRGANGARRIQWTSFVLGFRVFPPSTRANVNVGARLFRFSGRSNVYHNLCAVGIQRNRRRAIEINEDKIVGVEKRYFHSDWRHSYPGLHFERSINEDNYFAPVCKLGESFV